MVTKIAGEAGLTPKVTSTNVVHEFFQQSNETDWDFAWRLALMHDYEVVVDDTTLEFRPANEGDGGAAVALKWQDTLISFRPRMSGVQQPKTVNVRAWDPKGKKAVTGTAASGTTTLVGRRHARDGLQRPRRRHDRGHRPRRGQQRRGQRDRQVHARPAGGRVLRGRRRGLRLAQDQGRLQGPGRRRRPAVQRHVHGHVLDAQLPRHDRLPDLASRSPGAPRARCWS